MVAMLEAEEDFRSSSTLLEERMAEMGARLVLLPKFHPEFNPIECVYRCKIGCSENNFFLSSTPVPRYVMRIGIESSQKNFSVIDP